MDSKFIRGLGVFKTGHRILLYLFSRKQPRDIGAALGSPEGEFEFPEPVLIHAGHEPVHSGGNPRWHDFRIARIPTGYFLTYKYSDGKDGVLHAAFSSDLLDWHEIGPMAGIRETGAVVSLTTHRDRLVMYFGEEEIRLAFSGDLHRWRAHPDPVLVPRAGQFDGRSLTVGNVFLEREGILLLYYARDAKGRLGIGAALFDRNDPQELLWRSEIPLWQAPASWARRRLAPLGIVEHAKGFLTYWESSEGIFSVLIEQARYSVRTRKFSAGGPSLIRFHGNPIISPRPHRKWESKATFNPAAFVAEGKVHIIYRAIGDEDISYLGYAVSRDGIHIDERLDEPIYVPTRPFEGASPGRALRHGRYETRESPFVSGGGGWGGCEDPRVSQIGERLYMTYVAYDGFTEPRVALTSIALSDFLDREWNWAPPVLISSPNVVNKNACILPEKVNGKYVIFHRIYPDILIDYVDNLEFDGETRWLAGHFRIRPKRDAWDSRKLGVGATPIKTEAGWLLIYQGVGDQDPGRYKVGAMLLDLEDPTVVLHRSKEAILEPEAHYENHGHKWGVVYPCGAVVKDDQLLVYYGGADSVVCVASAPLGRFLQDLKTTQAPKITRLSLIPR